MRNKKAKAVPAIVYCFIGGAIAWFIGALLGHWDFLAYSILCLIFSWLFSKD